MTFGQRLAIAGIIVGAVLAATGAALAANLWTVLAQFRSNHMQDTYFVVPGPWSLVLFGVGLAGDAVFRRPAVKLGPRAVLLWWAHFALTCALGVAWLVTARLTQLTWPSLIVLLATLPALLALHGAALAAGGLLALRTGPRSPA